VNEGYFIGLMTGTSIDAVDTVLIRIDTDHMIKVIGTFDQQISDPLRKTIMDVSSGYTDTLHAIATLDQQLAELYAECVLSLLAQQGLKSENVQAIGCHGQTVRHKPGMNPPYTMQLGNGARLSELTGIRTINDFRQGDIAAGGQGAPLAPLFHHHLFANRENTVIGVNLGGIANISILRANGQIGGYDTGPANTLMDQWISFHKQLRYDEDASWARSGKLDQHLLDKLLTEPWLAQKQPKSTGPELFNLSWLDKHLTGTQIVPEDVQYTLCEYSALTICNEINRQAPETSRIVMCGGGAYNPLLVERIQHYLGERELISSSGYGIDPEWIEASMFAWFAWRTLNNLPSNVPAVTGAAHDVVLGTIHPGNHNR
jgi:anhydro-N-acetylmuramic acid kinase